LPPSRDAVDVTAAVFPPEPSSCGRSARSSDRPPSARLGCVSCGAAQPVSASHANIRSATLPIRFLDRRPDHRPSESRIARFRGCLGAKAPPFRRLPALLTARVMRSPPPPGDPSTASALRRRGPRPRAPRSSSGQRPPDPLARSSRLASRALVSRHSVEVRRLLRRWGHCRWMANILDALRVRTNAGTLLGEVVRAGPSYESSVGPSDHLPRARIPAAVDPLAAVPFRTASEIPRVPS
jgi:hypothetical protein